MPGGGCTLQFSSLFLGQPLTIIQHTSTACTGPQAGMWHPMLALPCREGAPLVVDEGGDEGVVLIWLQFAPPSPCICQLHTPAYAPTCTFVSFISTLFLGWWPPASSWILIAIWWMWRRPQGVGWGVATYIMCTCTEKRAATREPCWSWFSQL